MLSLLTGFMNGKNPNERAKFRLNLIFWDKTFDFINLPSILKESCRQLFPASLKEEDHPMVVYSLKDTIRSNIFNYNKFVSGLDFDSISADINSVPCFCHNFNTQFIDQHVSFDCSRPITSLMR